MVGDIPSYTMVDDGWSWCFFTSNPKVFWLYPNLLESHSTKNVYSWNPINSWKLKNTAPLCIIILFSQYFIGLNFPSRIPTGLYVFRIGVRNNPPSTPDWWGTWQFGRHLGSESRLFLLGCWMIIVLFGHESTHSIDTWWWWWWWWWCFLFFFSQFPAST